MEEETIVKISTNYKFKKREFLHLNNNGRTIEELIPNNMNMMLEPLGSIVEYNNLIKDKESELFVDKKDYKDKTEYEGVVIETTKQTIVLGISLEVGHCEEFGSGIVLPKSPCDFGESSIYPDNLPMEDFIGKKVQKVTISLDWDWNIVKGLEFKEGYNVETDHEGTPIKYHHYDNGGSVTIRIYTDLGIIKIYVYNIYNPNSTYSHNYFLSFYDHENQGEI